MKTILSAKRKSLLLAVLIIHHVLQANSASIQPDPETVISGRNRNLRTLPSSPPSPELDRGSHYYTFVPPPPSPTVQMHSTASSLRVVRKGSPPAPKVSRPRNFRIFPTPTRRPPAPPLPPPPPVVAGPPTNCNIPPPPPRSC
ncbi:hypothetical protein L6452_21252 [Arctium lappa]|uniref:Uncharacterized protein n=1 Tax=Arctium lappa TaxID=4217 RepID=A0ACB9BDL3_ARCLA|nr:hypothetical protein L6452_21252 [Arctium lappa]